MTLTPLEREALTHIVARGNMNPPPRGQAPQSVARFKMHCKYAKIAKNILAKLEREGLRE